MDGPRIAIIGSPWLRDTNGNRLQSDAATAHEKAALAACRELGRELASHGCRLLVYSAEAHSIEPAVVSGYVAVRRVRHAIEFRHPSESGGRFDEEGSPEEANNSETKRNAVINNRADPSERWEVSFYRSLKDADGVLLLGGRSTVLIAGQVALAFDKPVAAVACFLGTAKEVWRDPHLAADVTQEEYDTMGASWGDESAKTIVASLVRRHEVNVARQREHDEELARYRDDAARRQGAGAVLKATVVSFTLVLMVMVLGLTRENCGLSVVAPFVFGLTLVGVAGAGVRLLRGQASEDSAKALVAGAVAGFVFSLLYLLPQLADNNGLLGNGPMTMSVKLQIIVGHVLALMGGLAADTVLTSVQKEAETRAARLPTLRLAEVSPSAADGRSKEPVPRPTKRGANVKAPV